jgi:NAD(P)-dependent dehydrogenase (short-subunit alcohol dehydrogenase family)
MLRDKRAVVFGGGGSIGAAVATQFACDGAEVFLVGRTATSVEAAAKQIEAAGGRAHAAVVDALDPAAVEDYLESVVRQAGGLDIELNATGPRASEYAAGKPAVNLPVEEFMVPVDTVLKAQFITAAAAARQMLRQGSGVIIFLTGSPALPHTPATSGIGAAFAAIENLTWPSNSARPA